MKTQRRHDLRENELAQSLEALSDSVRRNSTTITIVTVIGIGIIIAAVMFINHRKSVRREAWQTIAEPIGDKPDDHIAKLRALADQNIDPAITAAALSRAGDAALAAMHDAKKKNDRSGTQRWADEARSIYRRVVDEYGSIPTAALPARFGLAILAEERGDHAEARQIYQTVLADQAARDTPFAAQAQYRLDHLDQWKSPVVFAPASAPATAPFTAPAVVLPAEAMPATAPAAALPAEAMPTTATAPAAIVPAASTQPSAP